MKRISGNNLPYAELCLHYGAEKFLDCAEKICQTCAAWDLLQRLHRLKIRYALRIDFGEYFSLSEAAAHEYLSRKLIHAGELLEETINFCDRHSTNPNYSAENYLEVAQLADNAINAEITFNADEEFAEELNLLYEKIFFLAESAGKNILSATLPPEEKIRLLEKIRNFYDANDYCAMYRSENFSDPEKQYFYQKEIDKLKPKESSAGRIVIDATGVSLSDAAFDYEFKGDFDKAIELYELAYAQGDEPYDYVLPAAAHACIKAGYTERAIKNLKRVLEIDREREQRCPEDFIYTCHVCSDLINIFFAEGRLAEARKYSEELIHYSAGADNSYKATHLVIGYYDLYRLESEPSTKKIFWERCLEKFQLLAAEKDLSSSLGDFLKTYAEKLPGTPESLETLDALISRTEKFGEQEMNRPIFERAIEISKDLRRVGYYVKFLTGYALYLVEKSDALCEEAMSYCEEAESFLAENNIDDEYLQSLIYYAQARCMSRDNFSYEQIDYVKRKCNCILLTEKKTEQLADAEKYEAWEDAADFYNSFDEHGGRLYCLRRALELIDAPDDFEKIWRLKCRIVECQIALGESEEVRRAVLLLYADLTNNNLDKSSADKIKLLATYLEKSTAAEEFFALNFFAIYVALAEDADKKLISSPTLSSADDEKFFIVFKKTLKENSSAAQVDFVNDICAGIESSAKHFPEAEKYLALVEDFIREHQFKEIDFND